MSTTEKFSLVSTSVRKQKRFRERRLAAGGESISLTLRPEAGIALRALVDGGHYPTKTAAIEAALIELERVTRENKPSPAPDG